MSLLEDHLQIDIVGVRVPIGEGLAEHLDAEPSYFGVAVCEPLQELWHDVLLPAEHLVQNLAGNLSEVGLCVLNLFQKVPAASEGHALDVEAVADERVQALQGFVLGNQIRVLDHLLHDWAIGVERVLRITIEFMLLLDLLEWFVVKKHLSDFLVGRQPDLPLGVEALILQIKAIDSLLVDRCDFRSSPVGHFLL